MNKVPSPFFQKSILLPRTSILLSPFQILYILVCGMAVISFFLSWIHAGFFGSFSGYKMLLFALKSNAWQAIVLLLIPLLFIGLAGLQFIKLNEKLRVAAKITELLLLALTALPVVYLVGRTLKRSTTALSWTHFFEFFGWGILLLIGCSLIIALSPLQKGQ